MVDLADVDLIVRYSFKLATAEAKSKYTYDPHAGLRDSSRLRLLPPDVAGRLVRLQPGYSQ